MATLKFDRIEKREYATYGITVSDVEDWHAENVYWGLDCEYNDPTLPMFIGGARKTPKNIITFYEGFGRRLSGGKGSVQPFSDDDMFDVEAIIVAAELALKTYYEAIG